MLDTFTTLEAELEAELRSGAGRAAASVRATTATRSSPFATRRSPVAHLWVKSASSSGAPVHEGDYRRSDGVPSIHYGEIYTRLRRRDDDGRLSRPSDLAPSFVSPARAMS